VTKVVAIAAFLSALALPAMCECMYVGAEGALLLPQGGAGMRRAGGAALRCGAYVSESWAVECEASLLENYAGVGAGMLGHWSGWSLYDRFFGYSAFDPFVVFGARLMSGGHAGPSAGVGAFYHLGESWSVRAQGEAMLDLHDGAEADYRLSVGLQCAF